MNEEYIDSNRVSQESQLHPLVRSESDAYVLQMDPTISEKTSSIDDTTKPHHAEKDVCYPVPTMTSPTASTPATISGTQTAAPSFHSTIDKDALGNYMQLDEDTLAKSDIKLDFLLEASQDKYVRRFSAFGDTIQVDKPFSICRVKLLNSLLLVL
jgi:magnesium transporter